MEINTKITGYLLIVFSIIVLGALIIVKINTDTTAEFLCEVTATNPDIDMNECPAHNSSTSWLLVVAFGMAFLILGGGVYLILNPFASPALGKKPAKTDLSKLDSEEKSVYELLKQSEGSMYQSDIMKATGHSKVKTTRLLDKLEQYGLVERKRRGMTNLVVLK